MKLILRAFVIYLVSTVAAAQIPLAQVQVVGSDPAVQARTNILEVVWPGANGAAPMGVAWTEGQAFSCPAFPQRGAEIIDVLAPNFVGGHPGATDDDRRLLTKAIIEQLVYEFPTQGWTWKSAGPGRPPSKDSISRLVDGHLCNWDWQNGSTGLRQVQAGAIGDDITGQNPIPVNPLNHLGPNVPPVDNGGGGSTADARIAALEAQVAALQTALDQANQKVDQVVATFGGFFDTLQQRVDALEVKPIPMSCSAKMNLGGFSVPLSCTLK